MAILGKYRKSKKDNRNSVAVKPSNDSVVPTGSNSSVSKTSNNGGVDGLRKLSNNSTTPSNGPYDQLPMGVPPDGLKQQQQYNNNSNNNNRPMSPSFNQQDWSRQNHGATSPQQGFRGLPSGGSVNSNGFSSPLLAQRSPPLNGMVQQAYPNNSSKPLPAVTHSQYPWSQSLISNASPFPRYGHSANAIAARDGEVFVMGGLKGSNVFGDLWVIETGKLQQEKNRKKKLVIIECTNNF